MTSRVPKDQIRFLQRDTPFAVWPSEGDEKARENPFWAGCFCGSDPLGSQGSGYHESVARREYPGVFWDMSGMIGWEVIVPELNEVSPVCDVSEKETSIVFNQFLTQKGKLSNMSPHRTSLLDGLILQTGEDTCHYPPRLGHGCHWHMKPTLRHTLMMELCGLPVPIMPSGHGLGC